MADGEPVYVFAEWCSGPRSGLAGHDGRPHLYQSLWLDKDLPTAEDEYALIPVLPGAAAELVSRLLPLSSPAGRPTLYPGGGTQASWQAFASAWRDFRAAVLAAGGLGVRAGGEMRPVPEVPVTGGNDPLEVAWAVRGSVPVAAVAERLAELDRRQAAGHPPAESPPAGEEMPF